MTPRWIVAFLDLPGDTHDAGADFWSAVTGFQRGPQRGEQGQFATLVPPTGTDYLRVQRLEEHTPRVHLDLHVDDPASAAVEAAPEPSRRTTISSRTSPSMPARRAASV